MAEYLLSKKYTKPTPITGLKKTKRGNVDVVESVQIVFNPMKIMEVPDDIDLSAAVRDGYLVKLKERRRRRPIVEIKERPIGRPKPPEGQRIRQRQRPAAKAELKKTKPEPKPESKPKPEKLELKLTSVQKTKTKPKPKVKVEPKKPEPSTPKFDYEDTDDGRFRCLHCMKILKTEDGMKKHIDSVHA